MRGGYILSEIYHYGVLGMKWGIRKDRERSIRNLKKAKTSNLEKWGSDEDHNVLYVAGHSGSGKTTTTMELAKANDAVVIHLDNYSEPLENMGGKNLQSKVFNSYLDAHSPKWRELITATDTGENNTLKKYSIEYWDQVDSLRKSIEGFGKELYSKNKKLIVEGVQIASGWLINSKEYYSDKPLVVLGTSLSNSMLRMFVRQGGITLDDIRSAKNIVTWYLRNNRDLNELANTAEAKRGQRLVEDLLNKKEG